jgi:hypothetical protein
VKEMMINQIQTFTTENKGNIIAQTWVHNLDKHCQVKGTGNTSPEVKELQVKDGKGGEGKEVVKAKESSTWGW